VKRVSIIPRNLKISEVSEKLSFHHQTSTNSLAVRRSCTIHFFNVNFKRVNELIFSEKILQVAQLSYMAVRRSFTIHFGKPDIKFQTHPGMST
jgi:hypothetical protein